MSLAKHSFFCENIDDCTLGEDESHHAVRVLRLKENQYITVINGTGRLVTAKITMADKKAVYFEIDDRIKMIDKSKFSLSEIEKLVFDFNPDTIVCSGWMDKDYLKILKKLDRKVQKVLSLDNHWNGNLKQRIDLSFLFKENFYARMGSRS